MVWRLVHVITRLELGGAQLATLHQVSHGRFARDRRDLVFGRGGLLDDEAAALGGVTTHPLRHLDRGVSPRGDLLAGVELWRTLRRIRAAEPGVRLLVHTHSSKAGILGRLAARLAGAERVVHTAHGFGHDHHGSRWLRLVFTLAEKVAGRVTDAFTADSAANIQQGRVEGLFAGAPARVVRCGIDVERFAAGAERAATRAALGIPGDHAVVLNLACLKTQKDPLAYARVAARVVAAAPRTTFLLAGDGELRGELEAEVRRLDLGDHFRLLGWRRDVPDLLAAADLLVLTSRWEGLPQAFPQAMAAGLPVIATRVDGAPEAVIHGRTGLLFEPGDIAGIAAAVVGLLGDAPRRRRMGEAGRARVEAFSQERMVDALEALYADVTGR